MTILGTTLIMLAVVVAVVAWTAALFPAYRAVSPAVSPIVGEAWAGVLRAHGVVDDESTETIDSAGGGTRADPGTGIEFPLTRTFEVGKNMRLLGVGTRKKAILKVYSVGFYGAKPVVKALRGKSGDDACGAVLDPKLRGGRAALLSFNMGVGTDKMAEAMSDVVGPTREVKDEFMDMLKRGMGKGKMRKGENMTFEWKGSDVVVVTVHGVKIGEMKDKGLHRGLLEIYFGDKSVSPSLKQDLGTALNG